MGIRVVWTILNNYHHRTTNYANCTEDRGDRMNNDLNVLRQNDIMTGRDLKALN